MKEEKSSKKVQFNKEDINKLKKKNTNNLRNQFKIKSKQMRTIDLEKEVFESSDMKDLKQTEIFPQTSKNKKEQEYFF